MTPVPLWVSLTFIAFFVAPIFMLGHVAKTGYLKAGKTQQQASQLYRRIVVFFLTYFAVVAAVSLTGFFAVNMLPPRVLLFTATPLFIFLLLVVQTRPWFKLLIDHIAVGQLVWLQLFRFVGVYFLIGHAYGALPKSFAYIGGIGDIATALLGIAVIYALKRKAKWATATAWAWNVFGLFDILSVLASAIVTTRAALELNTAGIIQFGTFPFSWIPAFAPATIIFLHIITFKKLAALRSKQPSLAAG